LKDHLGETKGQIKTLEAVFKSIGKKASGEKCDAIDPHSSFQDPWNFRVLVGL
jgi:ferritin-like metal-binding protein YciE